MSDREQRATSTQGSPAEADDNAPGVPGFRSWRGVYVFVFACFVAMVVALTLFSRYYG